MKRLILLVLTVFVGNAMSWGGGYKINLEYNELEYDEELMNLQIQLKKRDGKMVVNVRGEAFDDIDDPMIVHVAHFEKVDGEYLHLVNATASICNVLTRVKSHPILRIIMKELMKNSNIPTACPLKKGIYYVKDFMVNDEFLPPILPTGQFMSQARAARLVNGQEVDMLKITVYLDIENSKDKQSAFRMFKK